MRAGIRLHQRVPVRRRLLDRRCRDRTAAAGRDSTTRVWPVFSVTFLPTMRWSVSELAPGVNGMMIVIGRDDSSSAAALLHVIAVAATTRQDARML